MARFVRFMGREGLTYGVADDELVYLISGTPFGEWSRTGEGCPLEGLELLPPCQPSKILAVGYNYQSHADERGASISDKPDIYVKPVSCLAAHNQPILYPHALTQQVQYEAELVIVIGRRARYVTPEQAGSYIAGYTIGNDLTARDMQTSPSQWGICKGFDTFGPIGPWIETDVYPQAGLDISCYVNGELKQKASTADLIFSPADLVSYLSQAMTLEPGDIIFSGTPAGVGMVKPGDVVEIRIEGIGSLVNPVIDG